MTMGEKVREIALDYDKFHCCERREYWTGILDYFIVIDMSYDTADHFTVTLRDHSNGEEIECYTETRKTIVRAVDMCMRTAMWEQEWADRLKDEDEDEDDEEVVIERGKVEMKYKVTLEVEVNVGHNESIDETIANIAREAGAGNFIIRNVEKEEEK